MKHFTHLISDTKQKHGFTIVETLVAIAVLMIAVAGPLVVATKGLTSALVAKDQMIASYLAQETMEVIKNIRDNNLAVNPLNDWLNGIMPPGGGGGVPCSQESKPCGIDVFSLNYRNCQDISQCKLYYDSATGYNYTNPDSTVFTRYYYVDQINGSLPAEATVHVIVDWNEGTVPYQIELTSELVDTTR